MTVMLVWGATGLVATLMTTNTPNALLLAGMMLSAGLGLFVAYILSTKYPPKLV
jgi:hypothetical protein